jgi:hypothetical protein
MDITNKTGKPLSLPLPGGKKLFLGPGKTGQVTPRALEHPPLAKLLEAGDIESAGEGSKRKDGGSDRNGPSPDFRQRRSGAMRQSGDR